MADKRSAVAARRARQTGGINLLGYKIDLVSLPIRPRKPSK
jgi:hypothetical protein